MAGKRRGNPKSLVETGIDDQKVMTDEDNGEKLDLQTWSDLPSELLELVFSSLNLEDNIRASAVCKSWHASALSARVVNQSPWLMNFPEFGNLYELYDPLKRRAYTLELPELPNGSVVFYTKDSWLLLHRRFTPCVFFFNPFTREKIELPRFDLPLQYHQTAAFSCAPSSPNCVVFISRLIGVTDIAISTCHPGATEWVTNTYPTGLPLNSSSMVDKHVFCNGVFYCLSCLGWLGVFDPVKRDWCVLPARLPKCATVNILAEHNGDIIVICTRWAKNPIIFKLDQSSMAWEEMPTLDNVTLFANFSSCLSRSDLPARMRNSVYFPKFRPFGQRCIFYSLNDGRYYPRKQGYDWRMLDLPLKTEYLWIEPPVDVDVSAPV